MDFDIEPATPAMASNMRAGSSSFKAGNPESGTLAATPPLSSKTIANSQDHRIENEDETVHLYTQAPPLRSPTDSINTQSRRKDRVRFAPPPGSSSSSYVKLEKLGQNSRSQISHSPHRFPPPFTSDLESFVPRVPKCISVPAAQQPDISQSPLHERILAVGFKYLVYRAEAKASAWPHKSKAISGHNNSIDGATSNNDALIMSFATLQRMRLQRLQAEVVKHVVDMRYHGLRDTTWEASLQEYVQAWRDWDYMQECATRENDPFTVKTSRSLDAAVVREQLQRISTTLDPDDSSLLKRYESDISFPEPIDKPEILGGSRNSMNKRANVTAFTRRLVMAALAWAFIVGPMILMVLSNTRLTALLTTSVCVFAFGVLMARALDKPFDVLSATAAYAAVLMVFVGTNTAGSR